MESEADFKSFKLANLLPKEILHPKIADPVWRAFMRGEFDVAAFQALKAVEVSVRAASRLGDNVIGVKLMREAFAPEGGSLTDMNAEGGVLGLRAPNPSHKRALVRDSTAHGTRCPISGICLLLLSRLCLPDSRQTV
jgi:hypothetical protein